MSAAIGRPPLKVGEKLAQVLLAVKIVSLEQRLAKGWDYLDERPAEDRPGQRGFDLWLALLTEYQDACREFYRAYGQPWTFETRELANLEEDDRDV